jgi:HKD family nuclease
MWKMSKVTLVTNQLIDHLIPQIKKADSIYILTSFVMKSGVKLLKPHLIEAVERGVEVKLCAGDYLFITQPGALQNILDIPKIEVRIWRSNGRSFHPKAYIFGRQSKEQEGKFFIGSSNLSRSALSSGVEWNIGIQERFSPATYEEVTEEFLEIFYHENTYPLNYETVKSYQREYERY